MSAKIQPTIHARGAGERLDRVLELVAFAAKPCPLTTSLDELPRRLAEIFRADVCSIYLLESGDLVMRGNVGFPVESLGEVRLGVGEGITGMAVECMRPISVDVATTHEGFKNFPSLEEERFPVFLAVPVAGPNGPLGALVLQRSTPPPFDRAEIELAAALTAPIAAAAERAHLADALREQRRTAGGGTRRVTLPGRTVVRGRAVGSLCAFRRPASRPAPEPKRKPSETMKSLEAAIATARSSLDSFELRARHLGVPPNTFAGAHTILDDGRLRERVKELLNDGSGIVQALNTIGGEAAKAAARVGDPFALERAREISDVCEALAMLAAGDRRAEVPRGAVLAGDTVTIFDALVSARSSPAAIVLAEPADGPLARALLSVLDVPAVADVKGLFRWVSDGDLLLVDGDHGLVRLNPGRAEVALVREERKQSSG